MGSNREERLNMSIIRGREGKTIQVHYFLSMARFMYCTYIVLPSDLL